MKKFLAIAMAVLMLTGMLLSFASCGSKGAYDGLVVLDTGDLFESEQYGIACRKGTTTASEIDTILAELFADGTAARLAEKYAVSVVDTFEPRVSATATDASDMAAIKAKGKMVIGITDYKPMDYKDENGKWIGFDAEMAEAVCAKLGITAEFKEIDWDNKLIDLAAGNIDCIWNGMTITDAIMNAAEVSGVYMDNTQVLVIKEGAYTSVDQIKTLQIAVEGGSAGASQATAQFPDATIKEVSAQTDALLEVKAGTSQACVIDLVMAKSLLGAK